VKKLTTFSGILCVLLMAIAFSGCGGGTAANNVVINSYPGTEGLDLQALGAIMSKARNPQELEQLINDPSTHINNLDLNNDNQTDFVQVTETFEQASNTYSYDFTDADVNNRVATLTVTPRGQQAIVQTVGDPAYYGQGAVYTSHMSLGDALFLAYVFGPHTSYYAPVYMGGVRPSYYHPYGVISAAQYQTQTQTFVTTTKVPMQKTTSPEIKTQRMPDTAKSVPPPARTSGGGSQKPMVDTGSKQTSGPVKNFGGGSTAPKPAAPKSAPPAPRRR